jgi:hypothetical protein
MEFLKIIKRRSFLSEVIYVSLNVGLAVALMVLVRVTGSIWPSLILVLVSMWRIFAVRPQFWLANIQANLVSMIVSVSYVVFLYITNFMVASSLQIMILQIIFVVIDIFWLIFLKPQSKRVYVVAQAGVALFVGISAIFSVAYGWIITPVVVLVWLVGYATARHVLGSYDDEDHILLLSLAWGFALAEIGWLAYHWVIAYRVPIVPALLIPQVSIIVICLGFLAYKSYNSYYHFQKIRLSDIVLPLIFTLGIVGVLVIGLNSAPIGSI